MTVARRKGRDGLKEGRVERNTKGKTVLRREENNKEDMERERQVKICCE